MQLEKVQYITKAQTVGGFGLFSRFVVVLLAAMMSLVTTAIVLAQQPAQTGAQGTARAPAGEGDSIRPFQVHVPQEALDDLRRRIAATRWPEQETVTDGSQGVQLATMKKLASYWA